eukprot:TRINITY_DN2300_c0_g1_i2.p1 TRINITY_DN2300_c0_g1~~TRINITY_DN2300_c0_g1_i2.p1  ORF type:complete len:114 (-),score=25.84 TRINITY_DN2300_c0_g1_i2:235-576(-)
MEGQAAAGAMDHEAEPLPPHGEEYWKAVRQHWRRDHRGKEVTRDAKKAQEVQETVLSAAFPRFDPKVPLNSVVEVLDLMWEFGYDGHNLEEVAQEIADEQALGGWQNMAPEGQ